MTNSSRLATRQTILFGTPPNEQKSGEKLSPCLFVFSHSGARDYRVVDRSPKDGWESEERQRRASRAARSKLDQLASREKDEKTKVNNLFTNLIVLSHHHGRSRPSVNFVECASKAFRSILSRAGREHKACRLRLRSQARRACEGGHERRLLAAGGLSSPSANERVIARPCFSPWCSSLPSFSALTQTKYVSISRNLL